MRRQLLAIGPVSAIVAPGTFHTLHIGSAQAAFPGAATFICPGIEDKCAGIKFDDVLGDAPAGALARPTRSGAGARYKMDN
jgi:hypothetical protein